MGNGASVSDRDTDLLTLFKFLDQEHRGFLTLKDLIHAEPQVFVPHSIPALFYCDHEKDGTVSLNELGELVKCCAVEKKTALQELASDKEFRDLILRASAAGVRDCSLHSRSNFRRFSNYCKVKSLYCKELKEPGSWSSSEAGANSEDDDARVPAQCSSVTRCASYASSAHDSGFSSDDEADPGEGSGSDANASVNLERSSGVPATRTVAMYCSQREFEKMQARELDSAASSSGVFEESSTTAVDAAVVEKINKKYLREMAHLLDNDGAREQFMMWLWKLTDVTRSGSVETEHLSLLLQALSEDGIDVEDLVFRSDRTIPLSARIMSEFNTSHSGALSREEFMVLADLVTREYEYWESRHLDCVGDYELGRTLGKGSSALVRSAIHVETRKRYAAKIIKKGNCSDLSRLDREIQSLQVVADHPGIVGLHEILESEENLVLILEICGGGALVDITRLYPQERMPEDVARHFVVQLFDALAYCHENGVCHRDVRLDNIMLTNDGQLKLTDFGHSGIFSPEWDIFQTSLVGSVYNLSPEQIYGQCYSGEKLDVWSAGIVLYTLLVGRPPFFEQDTHALLDSIVMGTYEIPAFLSAQAQDLIETMIRVRKEERPRLRELMDHPWFVCGPKTPVVMDVVNVPVDPFFRKRPDLAEMIIAGTLHEYHLHFNFGEGDDTDSDDGHESAWKLRCFCPNMNIKFSLSLFTKNVSSPRGSDPESGRIGRLEQKIGKPSLLNQKSAIRIEQKSAFVDESGYDEDDEEDAEDDRLRASTRDDVAFSIEKQLMEYPTKRFSTSLNGSTQFDDAQARNTPTAPTIAKKNGSCCDMKNDLVQPFLEVRLHEGDSGLFLKICRNLKKICDTKLATAAESHRHKYQDRRCGKLRRNASEMFHNTTPAADVPISLKRPPLPTQAQP